ncbi:ATP synthase subunit delta [Rubripirellula amarantea]|uniref:ATP synthase subunit delta n=1 Tax=Rubripirellula amarantea TaxID=2527999 RepID=A0A5C5WGP0_9BACT|nr:ATP synthase F1 subunit delta [Rubripirellula amarantea]TWT49707.1 ATP synthase subunit delta [Rubripirellula amarantea]
MTEPIKHDTVLDTGAEQLGKTYARALIGAAQNEGHGVADTVVEQLGRLVDEYIAGNPKLAAALRSPRVSENEKVRVIDRLLGGEFHPLLIKFLKVMATRDRLGFIAAVRTAADSILDDMMGRMVASVRTAVPLDDNLRAQIVDRLSFTMNRQVRLIESVDPALIGGMVIRVGDKVFDSSVANRLDAMAHRARAGFSSKLLERFEQFTSQ